jgi:hypothetical protein
MEWTYENINCTFPRLAQVKVLALIHEISNQKEAILNSKLVL